jgi:hypothetical protein
MASMARTRKLFPSYGSALAAHLLVTLEREHIVQEFVAAYVSAYKRAGILGGPARDRELAQTIGREIVLAVVHEVHQMLPRTMGKKPGRALDAEEMKIVEAFLGELMVTLGRAWRWAPEDGRQFQRDLNLYSESAPQKTKKKEARAKRDVEQNESPFVGRVALLLDPSMIDQARRAARKFHGDVQKFAQKLLRATVRPAGS